MLWCANIWGDVRTRKYGVTLPLMAAQHLYAVTAPLPELAAETREVRHPLMRHQDHSMYFRQHLDGYGIGSYRHEPLMVDPRALTKPGTTAKLPFTPEHFARGWESTVELLPALKNATLVDRFNGMFAFTTDGYPIMGETKIKGLWSNVGLWLTHAGGAGRAIANWMTDGDPGLDLREADITRFQAHYATQRYISARSAQNYREVYDIIHPQEQIADPRNVRLSPFHPRLLEQGAVLFQSAGWESAQWYEANAPLVEKYGDKIPKRLGWASRFWSPIQGAEHLAVRENAGLFNLAALGIVEVAGAGALAFLNRVAANQVERPVGRIVYTSLVDRAGGIVADLTIVRRFRAQILGYHRRRRIAARTWPGSSGRPKGSTRYPSPMSRPAGPRSGYGDPRPGQFCSARPGTMSRMRHFPITRPKRSASTPSRRTRCACLTRASWVGSCIARPSMPCACGMRCGKLGGRTD